MARKRPRTAAKGRPHGRVLAHLAKIVLTLAAAAGVVAAAVWSGTRAGQEVATHPRYAVRFADIRCDAPPGRTRDTFLSEVRYLANAPETIPAVDPGLPDRLADMFARHPWVEVVDGVDVTPDREIRVRLRFRVPVLVVRVSAGTPTERMVDAGGVLLPPAPVPDGLAVLVNVLPPPAEDAGQVWDDPAVKRAAELAREFRAVRVEKTGKGWRVTQPDGRVLSVSW